uniref:Uncharacterized protein n=1 Tax=Corethron hystrix TaxID=216773 RepID=A0A7S1BE77_9STRA
MAEMAAGEGNHVPLPEYPVGCVGGALGALPDPELRLLGRSIDVVSTNSVLDLGLMTDNVIERMGPTTEMPTGKEKKKNTGEEKKKSSGGGGGSNKRKAPSGSGGSGGTSSSSKKAATGARKKAATAANAAATTQVQVAAVNAGMGAPPMVSSVAAGK